MHRLTTALTLIAVAATAAPALAQHSAHKHGSAPAAAGAATELADGEIRRIDTERGNVMLRHGEIRSINMGPMTMSFRVQDPKMLAGLAVGDKVKFAVVAQGENLLITQIRKAP